MTIRLLLTGGEPGSSNRRSSTPPKIAIFYSREDEQVRASIREHLKARERLGEFEVWDDRSLPPSKQWEQEIEAVIGRIDLAILLVSPTFLSSDFCQNREIPLLRERLKLERFPVLPVLVRHCDLEHEHYSWIKSLQFFPGDGKALLNDFAPGQMDRLMTKLVLDICQILAETKPDDQPDPPSPGPAGARLWQLVGNGSGKTILVDGRSRFGRGTKKAWVGIWSPAHVNHGNAELLLHQELRSVHFGGAGLCPWGEGSVLSKSIHKFDPVDDNPTVLITGAKARRVDRLVDFIEIIYTSADGAPDNTWRFPDGHNREQINCANILSRVVRRADRSGETLFKDPVEDRLFKSRILEDRIADGTVFCNDGTLVPVGMKTELLLPEVSM